MKKVLVAICFASLLSACGTPGSGEANFCEDLPASVSGLLTGDSVNSTPELAAQFNEDSAVTLEPGVATYWFRQYNSTYDYYCWNRVVKVDRATHTVISVEDR